MNKAVNDMDSGKGDLLKLTALQFNEAHRLRYNAWLESARLPAQMKKELKALPLQACVESEVPTQLFSEPVLDRIHQHVQAQKDNAWWFGTRPRPKKQNESRGGFSGHASNWQPQSYQGLNQPRDSGH